MCFVLGLLSTNQLVSPIQSPFPSCSLVIPMADARGLGIGLSTGCAHVGPCSIPRLLMGSSCQR